MVKMKINVIGAGVADVIEERDMFSAKRVAREIGRVGHFIRTPDEVIFVPPHLIGTINMEES